MRVTRRVVPASLAVSVAFATLAAAPRFTKQDADRFRAKLDRILQVGSTPAGKRTPPLTTPLTDVEVNSYLRYGAGAQIPTGIVEPTLNALGNGRVGGRAVVDLDAVRKQKPRGWLDPMGYLTGRLPVTATGRLTTGKGVGRFQLEAAAISGVPVPKAVLQELLGYYSRTPEDPDGINMDDPFELPSRIREIRVGTGTATVVQ
ncbi:MAG: hypothetical protein A3H96_20255 [Acidobacteria bacterium RIFCSPLOWO2_02_FULL_67_36]|nr:MAG: hypothetical protein A3H96_20255 [Acidobacteria bacterium RIFCSPLOWO2_02_FULL_67_36]OFW23367.1 MAG: hypothetical protein A3G21_10760 [Acidobacteria bacterium RIFCSPLOWO2_12_FULL_66_21]